MQRPYCGVVFPLGSRPRCVFPLEFRWKPESLALVDTGRCELHASANSTAAELALASNQLVARRKRWVVFFRKEIGEHPGFKESDPCEGALWILAEALWRTGGKLETLGDPLGVGDGVLPDQKRARQRNRHLAFRA